MSDSELLQRLHAGDEAAFDHIFRAFYARLVRMAEVMLGQRAPAEEIVQEVMLELWRRRENVRIQQSLQAYLFRATRNRTLNYIRHEKVEQKGAAFAAPETMTRPAGDRDLREREIDVALQAAIAELPARCREIFQLSRVQNLTYNEIAVTLDISVKTVEAQISKALRTLRQRMARFI